MVVKPKQNTGGGNTTAGGNSRRGTRKVKSGCQTCKRRKVKCDEIWPVCHRCESTGRICDGYGVWGGGTHVSNQCQHPANNELNRPKSYSTTDSAGSSPAKCIQLIPFRDGEQECFEWFMHRSAIKLPGVFRSNHWTTILFQASTTESPIKHAMLALGSAHKEEVRGDGYSGREYHDDQTLFTFTQYSRAISGLQHYSADGRRVSMHVTLISCALFIFMEFLRGSYVHALLHLEYGLNLLQESETIVKGRDPWSIGVDGWIITLFTRTLVQAKLLGQLQKMPCREFTHLFEEPASDTFRSIHHARRTLERIVICALDIREQSQSSVSTMSNETSAHLLQYERGTQDALQNWLDTRAATVAALPPTADIMERFGYRLLLLYYQIASVLVNTCLEHDNELCFDQHESTFVEILSHCVWTYKLVFPEGKRNPKSIHDPEPTSPNSVSDIGWITPLYLTAIKCRNPRVRRQAIRLLQSTVHKEGIWNAALVIPVAQRVMEIEEGDFYASLMDDDAFETHEVPTAQDLMFPALPADSRVSRVDISLPEDRAGKLVFTCRRFKSDGVIEWMCEEYDLRSQRWTKSTMTSQNMSMSTLEPVTTIDKDDVACMMTKSLDELVDSSNGYGDVY